MIKNLIICENLRYPPDEGASKLTVEFIESLNKEVSIINFGERIETGGVKAIEISYTKLPILGFVFGRLISFFYVLKIKPANIYYFPLCAPGSINQIYASILNILASNFKEVIFQTGDFNNFVRFFSRFKIVVFSKISYDILIKRGLCVEYASIPQIKLSKNYDKKKVREKYGIKEKAFVALHVGHAEPGRGLDVLSELQEIMPNIEIVVVLSSRNKIGNENLLNKKIKIISRYLEDIYEIFAAADVYLFPIKTKGSAIDIPLSIIEAKKMNLPVIASDVGSVKEAIKGYSKGYLIEVNNPKEMAQNIKYILEEKIIKK